MNDKGKKDKKDIGSTDNKDLKGIDKAPGEEKNKSEKVTTRDLKNKTVDADPEEDHKK
jgi:hypothetical protein